MPESSQASACNYSLFPLFSQDEIQGQLTGQDLPAAAEQAEADEIMIPANTLRAEGDLFLDDMPLTALTERFHVTLIRGGASLYEALAAV